MPFININSAPKEAIEILEKKIPEIADLIDANPEAINLIDVKSDVYPQAIIIYVAWKHRDEDKKTKLSTYLYNFFKKYNNTIKVIFSEVDDMLYINAIKK